MIAIIVILAAMLLPTLSLLVVLGAVTAIDLSLVPLSLNLGVTTIGYTVALNGSAGLLTGTGSLTPPRKRIGDWRVTPH